MDNTARSETNRQWLTAVVANPEGEIFELEGYAAVGMSGSALKPLTMGTTLRMPFGSELMLLPDRSPILYSVQNRQFEVMTHNP